MKVHCKFPKYHSPIQEMIMRAFITPGLREMWCACGTKFGKTLGGAVGISTGLLTRQQGMYRWIAPIYEQAKIAKRYCDRMLPSDPIIQSNESGTPSIRVPALNSTLQFWHGQRPVDLEGEGTHGNLIDEAAKQKEELYDSVKTTVTKTGGPIVGLSTPLGKGWFYKRCKYAQAMMRYSLAKGLPPEYIFLTAPTAANPEIPVANILDAKKRLIDRLFRQYYLAEFLDDGSVFIGLPSIIIQSQELIFDPGMREYHIRDRNHQVVIGVDWAKKTDFAVFTALSVDTPIPEQVGIYRFQHVKYTQAVKELVRFAREFKEVALVVHDRTGVGEALDDMLAATQLPYEGVIFTNEVVMGLINDLIMAIQTKAIRLLNWSVLKNEFDIFEGTVTKTGKTHFSAPSSEHDDIVMATALAHSVAKDMCGLEFEVKTTEDFDIDRLRELTLFERMLQDDDDFD